MSHDGCEEVSWKGQAFPYLMHHPRADKNDSYAKERARAAAGGGGGHGGGSSHSGASHSHNNTNTPDTLRRAGTGTWNGPAPVSLAAETAACAAATAANAAAAAAVAAASEPRFLALAGGNKLPVLGLGTYKIESPAAIVSALKLGYRHLDCASFYGNQHLVGEGIRAFLALSPAEQRAAGGAEPSALERQTLSAQEAQRLAASPITRADLFVTTKIWNTEHRPQDAVASVEKSLRDLGLAYVDCVLVHWPEAWLPGSDIKAPETIKIDEEVTLLETWRALEGLVAQGKVRTLGLSNASLAQVEEVLEDATARGAGGGGAVRRPQQQQHEQASSSTVPAVRPALIQAELHVLLPQRKLVGVLRRKGVACVAHSPLGSHKSRAALDHPVVVAVAKHLGKTPAQVLLRYNAQRGVAVIPKAEGEERQRENARGVFGGWRLDDDAKAALDAIVPSDASGQRAIDYPWKDWGDLEAGGAPKPSLCAALRGLSVA